MSFRLPQHLASRRLSDAPADALEVEVWAEKAASLAHAGRKLEQALADLQALGDRPERARRVKAAAEAAHALFIQRELLGFHRQADAVERYAIPREVLAKVGVR